MPEEGNGRSSQRPRYVPPQKHAEILVRYTDDDGTLQWWDATVIRLGKIRKKGSIACYATLLFEDGDECDVKFMRKGYIVHKDTDGSGEAQSMWKMADDDDRCEDGEMEGSTDPAPQGPTRANTRHVTPLTEPSGTGTQKRVGTIAKEPRRSERATKRRRRTNPSHPQNGSDAPGGRDGDRRSTDRTADRARARQHDGLPNASDRPNSTRGGSGRATRSSTADEARPVRRVSGRMRTISDNAREDECDRLENVVHHREDGDDPRDEDWYEPVHAQIESSTSPDRQEQTGRTESMTDPFSEPYPTPASGRSALHHRGTAIGRDHGRVVDRLASPCVRGVHGHDTGRGRGIGAGPMLLVQRQEGQERSEHTRRLAALQRIISREIRVRSKKGISTAILRAPARIVARHNCEHDGVLQTGVIVWSYNVNMERFQIFAAAMQHFNKKTHERLKRAPVRFQPEYEQLQGDSGFVEARASFSNAVDMFRFLGVHRASDIKTLLWNVCGAEGNHVRVLGGARMCTKEGEAPRLNMFVAHSCSAVAPLSPDGDLAAENSAAGKEDDRELCFTYSDATWDGENNCFAGEPSVEQERTGYYGSVSDESVCFQITWEVERNTSQRALSHVAMDDEGERNGKMEVQVPYFFAGPEMQPGLVSLLGEQHLDDIISRLS